MDDTPSLSATTSDPTATAPVAYNHLLGVNLIYRIFDRLENSAEVVARSPVPSRRAPR